MREKLVRVIVNAAFVFRYWALFILLLVLGYLTYKVAGTQGATIRDTVAVFAGGAVVITLFYAFINYEYTQRKFHHDVKSSRDQLSYSTAMEWQREYMVKNLDILRNFYLQNQSLLEDGKCRKIMKKLEDPKNDAAYTALVVVLNYLESVALCVARGMMDEEFIKGFFSTSFKLNYNRYHSLIKYRRTVQQNPKIWEHFTKLAEKWITCG